MSIRFDNNSAIETISDLDILPITDISDSTIDKKITMAQIKTFSSPDISGKQDLIITPVNNDVVTTDENGQTKDSGIQLNNFTQEGNTFNGASQLVKLNSNAELPAVSGVNLTGLEGKINPDKVALTAGTSNTLMEGIWHTLTNGSSTTSISMFTSSDTNKTQVSFVNFTTSSTSQPTFNTAVFDYTPTWDTSKHNLVTIFTENGTNYAANHRVLGY